MCEHIGPCLMLSVGLPREAETDQAAELQRTSHAEGKPRGQGRRQVQGTTNTGLIDTGASIIRYLLKLFKTVFDCETI